MVEKDRQLFDQLQEVLKNKESVYEIGIFNNWLAKFFDEDQLVEFFDKHFNDNLVQDNKVAGLVYEEENIVIEVKNISGLLKVNLYDYNRYIQLNA